VSSSRSSLPNGRNVSLISQPTNNSTTLEHTLNTSNILSVSIPFQHTEILPSHNNIIGKLINKNYLKPISSRNKKAKPNRNIIEESIRIKVTGYNARGLKDNDYLNILSPKNHVVFICETGAAKVNELEDQIANNNVKIYSKLGVRHTIDSRGSCKGGLDFLIDKKFYAKVNLALSNNFISATIADTTFIGVHLNYYTSTESSLELEA
jgi:hypothetical protein